MTVLFLLGFVGALGCSHALQPEVPPNIIIILADDMGMGDPGCYNPESKITTPAINRLAEEGMRFTDAHSPSAVCTPTRYGLLTGRYCWRSRQKRWVLQGYSPALIEENRATIASFLKEKGYATYGVGKWHLGLGNAEKTDYAKPLNPGPLEVGFDHWFGIPASLDMTPYVYVRDHGTEEEATEETKGGKHTRNGGTGFWRSGPSAPRLDIAVTKYVVWPAPAPRSPPQSPAAAPAAPPPPATPPRPAGAAPHPAPPAQIGFVKLQVKFVKFQIKLV